MGKAMKSSVLIVDDEKLNLKTLTQILGAEYTIYTAKDGAGAVEIAKEYLPDVILLDIVMDDMDGYEVIAILKETKETHHIPVIFITGLSNQENEEKGLALGAADYITKPFSAAIVKLRVRNQIKIIEQFRTIEYLSVTDQLTQIPNRRSFDQRMEVEWKRAEREKEPLTILVFDIDNFKRYNDTYGHLQGDVALQMVAQVAAGVLRRATDFLARWGGEEFIVLLPKTDSGGLAIGEQIRKSIEDMEIPCQDGTITKVTVSIGMHTVIPDKDTSVDRLISYADEALYHAKKTGKNKVCTSVRL